MKTVKVAQTSLFTCLEKTMEFYADMIYQDTTKFKVNKPTIEALESLVRTWATLQTTTNTCDIAEKISALMGDMPRSPELPFEFPPKKVDAP